MDFPHLVRGWLLGFQCAISSHPQLGTLCTDADDDDDWCTTTCTFAEASGWLAGWLAIDMAEYTANSKRLQVAAQQSFHCIQEDLFIPPLSWSPAADGTWTNCDYCAGFFDAEFFHHQPPENKKELQEWWLGTKFRVS